MLQSDRRALFHTHRERALERLARDNACALLFSGSPRIRNHDAEHRFRPDSDFWHLSGFGEPESVLVLAPNHPEAKSVLFLREREREQEIWNGRRLGVAAAPAALGVDRAHPIGELWSKLPELLRGHERLVYRAGLDEARDRHVIALLGRVRPTIRNGALAPQQWVDPALSLHELRLHKTPGELECMRRAAAISAAAHTACMRAARAGVHERELDALLDYEFMRRGASGAAYTNIVAAGENACILHYVEKASALRDGELLLVDAGAEFECYASDVTRTYPIGGRFTGEQRALYELVLRVQKQCIELVAPGRGFWDVHQHALVELTRGLIELGLLAGPLEEALAKETYRRFYMHRTSHWLGLDVHDCGAYHADGKGRVLEPGMVITVEPGLYIAPDDETVERRWRGIGVRIEDDIVVTADGRENLTEAIPKEIAELESLVGSGALPR
jgi:Xaa-Pro aminopeptidase